MARVWKEKGSISDQISGNLRAHLTNGILSMFLPLQAWSLNGGMLMFPQPVRVIFGCSESGFIAV